MGRGLLAVQTEILDMSHLRMATAVSLQQQRENAFSFVSKAVVLVDYRDKSVEAVKETA